jgi:hypothetical protein
MNVTAPEIDLYLQSHELEICVDEKTKEITLLLFKELQALETVGDDELRVIWLTVPRGTPEDFGNWEDYLDEYILNREDFERFWLDRYPKPVKWYRLSMSHWKGWYTVVVNGCLVLQIQPEKGRKYPEDRASLAEGLLSALKETIETVKDGTYDDLVRDNLPYEKRKGKILREDLWNICEGAKEEYLENITQDDIDRFVKLMDEQPEKHPEGRLHEMTARKYFECCRLGYAANKYKRTDELSAKELYRKYADGRDEGLLDLDTDSAEEFAAWYDIPSRGGHPWEVCRGGSSTHISLHTEKDDRGWWFSLAGSSWIRSIETVNFFFAIHDAGTLIFLYDGKELADMIRGRDHIGIVSEDIFPRYCSGSFPGENMLQYMNLPYEERDEVIKAAYWYPIEENVRLIEGTNNGGVNNE